MKNTIKNWLGITRIEMTVGKQKEVEIENTLNTRNVLGIWSQIVNTAYQFDCVPITLTEKYEHLLKKHENLKKDFEELDKKIDYLERYLQIEFFKTSTDIQVYDWASKNEKEGYRKTKTYEQIKKSKEKFVGSDSTSDDSED